MVLRAWTTSVDYDGAGVKAGGVGGWGLKVRI